jgi:hypothetical protein
MRKQRKQLNEEALHSPSNEVVGLSKSELDAYLAETAASDTLNNAQKTKAPRDAEARALALFQRLAPDEQEAHLDYLEKTLENAANRDGIPDDYAEKNRASLKIAQRKKTSPRVMCITA